jgi:hypothetical protein
MQEVWLVYVIYQYDGYDNTDVYDSKKKACEAADDLVFDFKQDGYELGDGCEDILFSRDMEDNWCCQILENKYGEVKICVEKKLVW